MCDINTDKVDAEEQMTPKQKVHGNICMKCKEEKAIVVVRIRDPLCRSCFLTYTTHKFRSTLGKARLVQANDKVLLALSGGHSSTALLYLVRDALSQGAHKRLKFSPGVICIDESETLPSGIDQDYSHIHNVSDQFEYPFYQVPIYQGYGDGLDKADCSEPKESDRHQFADCFNSILTLSAKQEFLMARRTSIIVQAARKNNYKKIMFGETATTLSIKLLCNVALGRGATLQHDIGVSDNRFPDITIIRPMREFSSKEVAIYNRMCQISVSPPHNINTMKNGNSSLQRKTEEFIIGLQTDFPSTVNTVFRTGDKLCMTEQLEKCTETCALCQSPLLNSKTTVKEQTSCGENEGCCGTGDDCTSKIFRLTSEDMKTQLCYGCNLTFKDMGYNVDLLPQETLHYASSQFKRRKIKESIQEFLLE